MYSVLIILYIVVCVALITIVMLQSSKGEGLAGVFGSGGGTQTIFGARTGDVLTKSTTVLAILFMFLSLFLAILSGWERRPLSQEIPPVAGRGPGPMAVEEPLREGPLPAEDLGEDQEPDTQQPRNPPPPE